MEVFNTFRIIETGDAMTILEPQFTIVSVYFEIV